MTLCVLNAKPSRRVRRPHWVCLISYIQKRRLALPRTNRSRMGQVILATIVVYTICRYGSNGTLLSGNARGSNPPCTSLTAKIRATARFTKIWKIRPEQDWPLARPALCFNLLGDTYDGMQRTCCQGRATGHDLRGWRLWSRGQLRVH